MVPNANGAPLRFRQKAVVIPAENEDMFLQLAVLEANKDGSGILVAKGQHVQRREA